MNNPSQQNTMSSTVMINYRSKKIILKSVATDIAISSSLPVFDPAQHKFTLHVQSKEAIRDFPCPGNEFD